MSARPTPRARSGPFSSTGPLMDGASLQGIARSRDGEASGADRLGVAFLRLVAALVVRVRRPADLRVGDDAVAPRAAEVLEALPPAVGVLLQELAHALDEALDDVRPHGTVEH